MPCLPNDFPGAVTTVPVLKNFMSLETEDVVAEEVPVALVYNGISHTVMMASPVMLEEFGTGFSLTEGIVESVSDIYDVEVIEACGSGREVRITISSEAFHNFKARRRAMLGRTGCGICGVESLGDALRPVPDLPATQTFDMRFYRDAVAQLKRFERIGALTGCTHASVWIRPDGTPAGGAEDVRPPRGARQAPRPSRARGLAGRRARRELPRLLRDGPEGRHVRRRDPLCSLGPHGARRENGRTLRDDARGLCTCGRPQRLHAPRTPRRGAGRKALRLSRSSSGKCWETGVSGPVFHSEGWGTMFSDRRERSNNKIINQPENPRFNRRIYALKSPSHKLVRSMRPRKGRCGLKS